MRKILVTAALPYASGDIHIGHLVEYTQTDIWVRFQKMRGNECHYMCATDSHGTPIMLAARKLGVKAEDWIRQSQAKFTQDFKDFEIDFTHFSTTHSEANRELCEKIFALMKENGHIEIKTVKQAFDPKENIFLPDRFVKGTCPNCGAPDQYGDSCEKCSATYSPLDMADATSVISGEKVVAKDSEHLFFKLNDFKEFLQEWVPAHNSKEMSKKLMEWFEGDLRAWDISRDEPYFGFAIPGFEGKYFYVWVDAPIGYIAATKEWCDANGKNYQDYWQKDDCEIYHFIGKDIVYFHALFWPAMLKTAGYNLPRQVFVHGMLTVNGEKMSKSKGTSIKARTYLEQLEPLYLRYYYACKLGSGCEDLDLNLEDFVSRVNSDLIGKITNLASRGAQMLQKRLDNQLGSLDQEGKTLLRAAQSKSDRIAAHFEAREYSKAIVEIRNLADEANRYFDSKEPWKQIKTSPEETRKVLTATLNVFRVLAIYLKPVLPSYAEKVENLFGESSYQWSDVEKVLESGTLSPFVHLAQRLDEKKLQAVIENSKEVEKEKQVEVNEEGIITIDDFSKVDLRVAEVIQAGHVEGADKLLQIRVSVGDVEKQVFAGIKSKYAPEELLGKKVILVNNLKPRMMKFGLSEGMLLAAGGGEGGPFLVTVDSGAKAGHRVK